MVLFPSSDGFCSCESNTRNAFECKSHYVPAVYSLAQQPLKNAAIAKNLSINEKYKTTEMNVYNK